MSTPPRGPGRPMDQTLAGQLLRATQDLLVQDGVERLTMDAVARRCGASKATLYRRWPSKTALVVAATADLFHVPEVPDTGDLREDLLACGRTFLHEGGRHALVLASVMSAARHDVALRDASREAVGAPFGALFEEVLRRAADRGLIRPGTDVATVAQVFPAVAYQQLATQGRGVDEADVVRVVDGVLLPAVAAR